jgi:histone-arginine methyltransferase CARM1
MSAVVAAITSNAVDFTDKVVMDVGTGSGILAWFAIKAGARKVYAVEASDVADRASQLMVANGVGGDRIVVLKAKVEAVTLPDDEKVRLLSRPHLSWLTLHFSMQVDVLISEPMGFMLVHERMLESYIIARQMFLKPGGLMFPNKGTIFALPFTDSGTCTFNRFQPLQLIWFQYFGTNNKPRWPSGTTPTFMD